MKKKYLMMAAFATMLAGCSNDAEQLQEAAELAQNNAQAEQVPITFDAYVNRATTRAGQTGELTDNGTNKLASVGFGVIAYYTDDDLYSPIYQPNFMYNAKVIGTTSGSSTTWSYTPVRYWPNETGESGGVDRLSFFAYAPYVQVDPATGIVNGTASQTSGIVGLSRNGAIGDPFVKYYVDLNPAKRVDLCWGVSNSSSWTNVTGTTQTLTSGAPYIDLIKTNITNKVNFNFKHALASLNVQIDAIVDAASGSTSKLTDNNDTKIYVRKVTFEGFVLQGSFNLNTKFVSGSSPAWYDLAGSSYINGGAVTVYDGRTDGREAISETVTESPVGLNPVLVQSKSYTPASGITAGVTETAVNLFNSNTQTEPIYVIPSNQAMKVTIVYDVETKTDELPTYLSDGVTPGTSVQNTITKTVTFSNSNSKLVAGNKYTVKLHLGMTSVKVEGTVSPWGTESTTPDIYLPQNQAAVVLP